MWTKQKSLLLWWGTAILLCITPLSTIMAQNSELFTGSINNDSPYTEFSFSVEQDGSTIILDISPTSGDLDTLLYLVDRNGNILAENDDRSRQDYSSRIEFPQADAGHYTAIATRYGVVGGSSSGDFELRIEITPAPPTPTLNYRVSETDLQAAGFPTMESRPEAEWTILAYYGGDNNLEPSVMTDFNEFELAGGSSDQVRIVMLLDRSPEFTDADGNWSTARIFEIQQDVSGDAGVVFPPTLDTAPLADLGVVDTGNGEPFAQFLVWAIRHYPSQNYAIALASHGAGWQGIITDDSADHAIMSVPELREAFRLASAEAGGGKFRLLINDACLMSSVEYFAGVMPYFELAVASPEIVVDPALDMTVFTNRLKQELNNTNVTILAEDLVDQYIGVDVARSGDADAAYFTHAVTNLANFDPVTAAIERFARIVNANPREHSVVLGQARANTYTYTGFAGSTTRIDLGSLMRQVIALSFDDALISAANDVLTALDNARVYADGGERVVGRIWYYNIYFPESSSYFELSYFAETPLTEWARMLRNYYNMVTPQVWSGTQLAIPFHPPIAPRIRLTSLYPETNINIHAPVTMGMELVGRNVSYADFTIDYLRSDGLKVRMSTERILQDQVIDGVPQRVNSWRSGVDVVDGWWDILLPVVTDGSSSNNELLIFTEAVAFLDGYYLEPGGQTRQEVSVIFDHQGNALRAVNRSTTTGSVAVVTIPIGSSLTAYRSIVTPDGRVTLEDGNSYIWPEGGLTWSWQPAPSGQYYIGALVTTFGGTTDFDDRDMMVNNEGLDYSLRGETWTQFGFTFTRPQEWSRSFFFRDMEQGQLFVRSSSPDETSNITVYFAPRITELEEIANYVFTTYGMTSDGVFTPITLDGMPTIEFTASYQTDQGTFRGKAFARYNSAGIGFGEVYISAALEGTGDYAAVYQQLVEHIDFFDPNSIAYTYEWGYLYGYLFEEAEIPMPLAWQSDTDTGGVADGIWTRYGPIDNPASLTFAAFAKSDATTNARDMLTNLVNEYAATAEGFAQVTTRVYSGENHTWNAVVYNATRNGQVVVGRMYVTVVGDFAYAMWCETPDDGNAARIYAEILEPILDGFIVYSDAS